MEHTSIDGSRKITVFERGIARLVAYEVDHLHACFTPTGTHPRPDPSPSSDTGQRHRREELIRHKLSGT